MWAFILAIIWSVYRLDQIGPVGATERSKVSPIEIWHRFPKFVIGFTLTFLLLLLVGLHDPSIVKAAEKGSGQANLIRTLFFALCFFSIGMVTNVRKLWAEGMGRIVAVYAVCLFGFILWVGLLISWLFYKGIMPPIVSG